MSFETACNAEVLSNAIASARRCVSLKQHVHYLNGTIHFSIYCWPTIDTGIDTWHHNDNTTLILLHGLHVI